MHFHMHGRDCGPRGRGGYGAGGPAGFGWDMAADRGMGRGGGRARRMFDRGELRLVLLRLIADAPRHGYELIKAVEELSDGAYAPSPGVIYPSLAMLVEMALIEEQASDGARKRFAATGDGAAHLSEHAERVAALIARLGALGTQRHRGDPAPVLRAMANLRHAVQDHMLREDADQESAHAIAALIDEAAQKIERLR